MNTVKELIAYARANPGKLNVASSGIGTPNHLGVEPSPSSPEELTRYMHEESARWAKLIKAAHITVD